MKKLISNPTYSDNHQPPPIPAEKDVINKVPMEKKKPKNTITSHPIISNIVIFLYRFL